MKKYFFSGLFLLAALFLNAQSVLISGKVIDSKTDINVDNVSIIDNSGNFLVSTNAEGTFNLEIEIEQEVTISFTHLSYSPFEMKVNGSMEDLVIKLSPKIEYLSEVEIMGVSKKERSYRTESVELTKLERSNLQDVGDMLRGVPNMSGVRKGAAGIDPVLRGFKYSQLNVQLNGGTRIEGGCPNRMDPATAHVDINDVKNITILKGPFALKYGVNFAGVIDMTTYNPEFYEKYETRVNALLGGQTNHTGFKTKVGVSGANKVFTYNVTGSWKEYDDYQDGNGEWVHASLKQQAYSASVGFKLAKKHVLYATAELSQGRDVDFPTLPMDERKDDTKIYSLNYYANDVGKSINFIRFKAYLSDVSHEMDNKNRPFSDTVVAVANIDAVNAGGKFGVNFNVGEAAMEVGADYENISKDGERVKSLIMQPKLPKKVEDLWNKAKIQNIGVFAEYHKPGKNIDWTAAARLDLNSANSDPLLRTNMGGDAVYENANTESQYTNFSISGGLSWHINQANDIVFSIGRGARSPDMTERFIILLPVGYDPYDYLGNPELKPEINHELDLGYKFNSNKIGNFYISTFFSLVNNYITGVIVPPSQVRPQTKGVLGVKQFTNIDRANMAGFEFSYQTPAKYLWVLNFNAAYTIGWNPEATVNIIENGEVVGEEVIENDPLPEIPPFEMNLSFRYKLFKSKFIPGISLRWVAEQNRTSKAYNENTTPGFTLVDLDIKYSVNKYLSVYAGVRNLFNTAYYEHLNRNIIGTTYPLYESGRIFYANLIFNL